MTDVDKMHFEPRENNLTALGQRKLHRLSFDLGVRGSLHFGL